MDKLRRRVLYTDMDGTLISDDHTISARNRAAIGRFVAAGGLFSVATGRNALIAAPYVRGLALNAPAILLNGCAVTDLAAMKTLHQVCLEPSLAGLLARLAVEAYPAGCVELVREGPIGLTNPGGLMDHYIQEEKQPFTYVAAQESYEGCMKVIVYGEHDKLEAVRRRVERALPAGTITCMYSAPFYFEMLPPGASKGAALRWIAQYLGCGREEIAAVGDFYNDVEMLQAAGLGVAVGNAPDEVKGKAGLVVADNNHDALGDLIENHLLA